MTVLVSAAIAAAGSATVRADGAAQEPPSLAVTHTVYTFADESLAAVVGEVNRHNQLSLVICDGRTAGLGIGGQLKVNDLPGVLDHLRSAFGIKAYWLGVNKASIALVLSRSELRRAECKSKAGGSVRIRARASGTSLADRLKSRLR